MAERDGSSKRPLSERTVYEPRLAVRRIERTLLALGVVGYIVFEGWSFTDALYMTVITVSCS
jgi:hypothetical protein